MSEQKVEEISGAGAVKEFFNMSARDAMEQWRALSPEEKAWYGAEAAKALGKKLKQG